MRVPATARPAKMNSDGMTIAVVLMSFLHYSPLYFVVFGILGLLVGFNIGAELGFPVFIFGPLITHFLYERWRLSTFDQAIGLMWDYSLKALNSVDYFWPGWSGSIALDVEARNIAIIHRMTNLKKPPEITVIPFDKIVECQAHIAEADTVEIIGRANPSLAQDVLIRNTMAKDKASAETGLYFIVDEISSRKHFVSMPKDAIQIWVRLFNKMKTGELKVEQVPVDTTYL